MGNCDCAKKGKKTGKRKFEGRKACVYERTLAVQYMPEGGDGAKVRR